MSKLLPPIDHVAVGLPKLIHQYREQPNFVKFVAVVLQQVQYLEDAIHDSVDAWDVDTAVGWRLRAIGELVGQPNVSEDDNLQRTYIQARIAVNRSRSKIEDILKIARLLLGDFKYDEISQLITVSASSEAWLDYTNPQAIQQMLQQAAPAGVRLQFVWNNTPANSVFRLASTWEQNHVVGAANGLCTTNGLLPANAGELSAVI